jgi:hypothetical protein
VAHTELTDEPCPECGASLDINVTPPSGTPAMPGMPGIMDPRESDTRKTIELSRVKVCPECGWRVVVR